MELQTLYTLAEQENIGVYTFPVPKTGSVSVCSRGSCAIALDPAVQDGGTQERVHLIHELGHCVTGSFYNYYAPLDLRRRHENRADKWAILRLISAEALDEAVAMGHTTLSDLAEHFGVTEDFMRKAVCFHTHGNLAAELYF